MSDQLHVPAHGFPTLPPVSVDEGALERFNLAMDRQLFDFDDRFFVQRRHPQIGVMRHKNQPPRKPR
ncbi:MAG TPA: hypothetical protein PKC18_04775 [Lacipirellulaceae bacterium]|nr:hypothetical protein [Lacipirellulaceae bacterium]